MALCIVLFCTEYRSGLKHAVKYADHHLLVELRALCEHCRTVEIIKLKYVRTALCSLGSDLWGTDFRKALSC